MAMRFAISCLTSGLLHAVTAACLLWVAAFSIVEQDWEIPTRSGGAIVLTVRATAPTPEEVSEEQPPVEIPPPPAIPLLPTPTETPQPVLASAERVTLDSPAATEFAPPEVKEPQPAEKALPVTRRAAESSQQPMPETPREMRRVARRKAEPDLKVQVSVDVPTQIASALGSQVDRLPKQHATNVHPPYPADAIARGEMGRVMIRATIGPSGAVSTAKVHDSSGSVSLDRAALEAVQRWRFEPAQRGGASVAYEVLLPIDFVLRER